MAFSLANVLSAFSSTKTKRPNQVVGIDYGSSSVKVVEVKEDNDVIMLSTYGELQLGPYEQAEMGRVTDLPLPAHTEAIVDVLRESNVKAKDGVMTLPLSDSFVTVISLTAPENEDIAPRVHVEARKHIPVPMADVSLEWTEVEPIENTPSTVREVLLAAIQTTALQDVRSILETLKMASQQPEIELFSSLRAISKDEDDTIVVIDLGAQTSKLYIAQGGYLRRIHRVRAGGQQVTSQLAQTLNVSFEEAENMKRNFTPGSAQAGQIQKIATTMFERPLQEFKRVINQHEIRSGKPVSRIVLSGGAATFFEFEKYASYELDRQVSIANPFTKVAYPAFMEDTLTQIAPVFAVALGAALRPFEQ